MYYLYYDAHGNQVATADSSGDVTSTQSYDPWGEPQSSVAANQTIHAFVGKDDKQYDTTTGFVLMGARLYDPTLGRFLQVDPIDGGSLNNYDYAGQDPINNYDLSGDMVAGASAADIRKVAKSRASAVAKKVLSSAAGAVAQGAGGVAAGSSMVTEPASSPFTEVASNVSNLGPATGGAIAGGVSQVVADQLGGTDYSTEAEAGRAALSSLAGAGGAMVGVGAFGLCSAGSFTIGDWTGACGIGGIAAGYGATYIAREVLSPVSNWFGWGNL